MALSPARLRHGDIVVDLYDDPRVAAADGWDDVVSAAAAPVFYQSTYLAAYHDTPLADLAGTGYLVARARPGGRPLAVLPVALHRRPDPLGCLRRLHPGIEREPALLSHVWHCYDARIVGADGRSDVVGALLCALRQLAQEWGARWFGFVNVERGGSTATALQAAGLRGGHLIDRFTADLAGLADLEDYLRRIGPRARANLRRTRRRAADCGLMAGVRAPGDADLDEVAELCGRTAARFGNPGFYPAGAFVGFVRGLGPAAHLLEVRQHGRLVAVGVCLTDELRFHTWSCGVDYAVAGNASPYALLFAESVGLALRLGRRVLEGGRSNEVFKLRHGLVPRHLDAYVVPT
jgi:CelD/BcsL family acetyltransferase involved in cellulose biosynthesis